MNIQEIKNAFNFILARRYREVGGDLFEDERRLLSFMPDAFGGCHRYRKEYEFLSDCFTGGILKIVIDITSQSEIEKQSTIQKIISCWTSKYNMDEQKASDLVEFFVRALHENNDNQGLKKMRKLADQDNANEQQMCGDSYFFGCSENKDYAKAVNLYRKAAERGNAAAQFMLGQCYHRGLGIGADYEQAVKYYTESAKQGNANAQFMLGQCDLYIFSCDVDADMRHIQRWGSELREQGDESYNNAHHKWFNSIIGFDLKREWNYDVKITKPQFIISSISYGDYPVNFGVIVDREQAVKWCSEAAEQGDADAQFILGHCYFFGCGVIVNCEQSAEGYKFRFLWCLMNDSTKDYAEAVKWYRNSAEQGNANAQFMLSQCYFFGLGVDKDYAKAVEWLHKSSALHSAAMMALDHYADLGKRYFYGLGVDKDYEMAADWYHKSALLGDATAQFMLGLCYFSGFGVKKRDLKQAVEWYCKSAKQGHANAQFMLGQCYFFGFGNIKEDQKQAVELYRKAAGGDIPDTQSNNDVNTGVYKNKNRNWLIQKGHYRAQFMLGNCYYYGCGVMEDRQKAGAWYLKLLLFGGDIGARFMLEKYNSLGCGINNADYQENDWVFLHGESFFFAKNKNYAEAARLYSKAAEEGHACALFALGDCYFYGHGITPDLTKAAELYSKAAEKGDTCAQCALGDCYFYGYGKDIDWAEAAKLYSKAAEQGDAYAELMLRKFCDVNQ